jgi:hypothetical protein
MVSLYNDRQRFAFSLHQEKNINLTERETGELKRFVGINSFKLHKSRFPIRTCKY